MYQSIYKGIKITDIDLIDSVGETAGSYLCTWWNQSSAAQALGLMGTGLSEWRDALNQDALFETEEYFHPVPFEHRRNLIFLMDDGWDIPIGTPNDSEHNYLYGSVDPDKVKFSRYGSTPEERLKNISDKVKEMGYAGLGLWISPQECLLEEYKEDSPVSYWEKRAKWCAAAGVLYWKVDWGRHDYDDDYRSLISECAHKFAPGLLVEHAIVQKPLTHNHNSDTFLSERAERAVRQMTFCDAFRTYDLLEPFDKVCTLRRAHEALVVGKDTPHTGKGLINGENMYSVVAGLSLAAGIMNYNENALSAINWQKLSPPFGAFDSDYSYSREFLCDTKFFDSEICEWAPCKGLTVEESAPAIMARGCPLPTVSKIGEHAPFVMASKNPKTKAYSVATVQRSVDPVISVYFPANVTLHEVDISAPLGVFGVFNTLTVEFDMSIKEGCRILAQDLTSDKAADITELAKIEGNKLVLSGKLLRYVGKLHRGHNNQSEPSLIMKIV